MIDQILIRFSKFRMSLEWFLFCEAALAACFHEFNTILDAEGPYLSDEAAGKSLFILKCNHYIVYIYTNIDICVYIYIISCWQAATRVVDLGHAFLQKYVKLAFAALGEGRPCYKLRPKWHELHHMLHDIERGSRVNPRLLANWHNEAYIGRLTKTSRGTHPATVGLRVLQRWQIELKLYYCKDISAASGDIISQWVWFHWACLVAFGVRSIDVCNYMLQDWGI